MSAEHDLQWRADCRHFRGDIPCRPHKLHGVHCPSCEHYDQVHGRILIIKLGAAGDVLRTTCLVQGLRNKYPQHEIWWITQSPELLPSSVDKKLSLTAENMLTVESIAFDVAINLDKDLPACALMHRVKATTRFGFTLVDARPAPVNELAQHKFVTGLFDDLSKQNAKSYPQEIYEICGMTYDGQEYMLDAPASLPRPTTKPIIGLNTGCGDRWISREWPSTSWESLIGILQDRGYDVLLLGGPAEHERNVRYSERTGSRYAGVMPMREFIAHVNTCDVVVTAVTLAMHITIGLKKQLVLMNNIFNPHEFELYGRGVLLHPDKPCHCYFKNTCEHQAYQCMDHLAPVTVADAVTERLQHVH